MTKLAKKLRESNKIADIDRKIEKRLSQIVKTNFEEKHGVLQR
jgi:hypothetical protein